MRIQLTATLALLVAACGTSPREECVTRANAEVERLDMLIEETEENLLRGYSLEPDDTRSGSFKLCAGGDGPLSLCAERSKAGEEKPVAINPVAERVKLANLRQRRVGLAELAERDVIQCEALHKR